MGGGLYVPLGVTGHLSIATPVPYHLQNSIWALLPHQPKGLGDAERFHSDITFLLVSTEEGTAGDRMYGLSMVWVNPYQASIPTVEEVVKQLTDLVSSGPNWPYALVWLNGDTCHVPLSREGHLGILPEGGTSSATCWRVSQLEVCQLLSSDSQVIYPVGLNRHKIPVVTSLPKSLANGTNLLGGETIYLKWTSYNPLWKGQNGKHFPLAIAPPSWWPAPSRLLCQRQKERSAWPWKSGNSYPRWD